jgi:hypothetical protein
MKKSHFKTRREFYKDLDDFIRDMPCDKWYPTKGNEEVIELIKEYIRLEVFYPDYLLVLNKDSTKFQKAKIPKEKKVEKNLESSK